MSPVRMTKIESAARVVLEFNEAFNRHDVPAMMHLMTEDCVFENTAPAPNGTAYKGRETVTHFWDEFFRESPAAHIEIEDLLGMGSTHCVMRWIYSWGNGYIRGVDVFKLRDGLICEKLSYVKG